MDFLFVQFHSTIKQPEIFNLPIESFAEFGDFISDEFQKIHHRNLKV